MASIASAVLRNNRNLPNQALIKACLLVVLLIGIGLRFIQLGTDCFWFDEVGVARVAQAPTLAGVLAGARGHVMGMPLDYLVAWMVTRANAQEWALRIPSAVWGWLALVPAYILFRKLANQKVAILATLFLALSPLHIRYSQELRFYAPLTFFSLAATCVLLKAIEGPSIRRWAAFTGVALVGIFFHVYVVFVLVTGLIWIVYGLQSPDGRRKTLAFFLPSSAVLASAFGLGWLLLTGKKIFDFPLLYSEYSIWKALVTGLGWLPPYMDSHQLSLVLSSLYGYFSLIGALTCVKNNRRSYATLYLISAGVQIGLIILTDLVSGYFFKDRQLLVVLPVSYLFAATGFVSLLQIIYRNLVKAGRPRLTRGVLALILMVFILLHLPSIESYYAWNKNDSCRISQTLVEKFVPGSLIMVIPKWESLNYTYYIGKSSRATEIVPCIQGLEWEELPGLERSNQPLFLVTDPLPSPEQKRLLEVHDFALYPGVEWGGKLWYRDSP